MLRRLVACLVFVALSDALDVRAAELFVDPAGGLRTVSAAIDSAAFGDTLVLAHDTFFENPRIVDKDLLIRSAPGGRAVLDGGPNGGGGNAGSVLRTVRSFVHIEDVVIQNGVPLNVGAGVMIFGGHVTLRRVRLERNVCGVLSVQDGNVTGTLDVADCEVIGNAFGIDGRESTRIVRTRFEGNDFALRLQGAVELEDVQIINNGGPLIPQTGGVVLTAAFGRLERVIVRGNHSAFQFGGMWLKRGPFEVIDCDVSDNVSEGGPAGLVCAGVDAELTNVTITNNRSRGPAQAVAGLLVDNRADVNAEGCRIENNDSEERGGGVSVQRQSSVRLVDCRVVGNSTFQKGGGVFVSQSTARLQKVVLAGNRAVGGGGILVESGLADLVECTVAGNIADGAGGALYNTSTGRIERSIVAFNEGDPGMLCAASEVTTACSNVFGNGIDTVCGIDLGGNLFVDPGFCEFDPERASFDLRLQENSPLIEAEGCGLIGARGATCSPTAARSISWSRLKELFGTDVRR
jgi:hypothetical protein